MNSTALPSERDTFCRCDDESRQALVQVLAELADLARVFGDEVLAPAIGDDLEQRHESGGRRDDDALLERGLDQIGTSPASAADRN